MNSLNISTNQIVFIKGNLIDRKKWDCCIDNAINGNICVYSWFLDIMCRGWAGMIVGDYEFVMPVPVSSRFGVSYLLQPRFIQQAGVIGKQFPDLELIHSIIKALPTAIKVIDYHFNDQNILTSEFDVEIRNNFLLKIDKPYEELRLAYSHNLIRNLKKSAHSGFHVIKNDHPEPLISLFREMNGRRFSSITAKDYSKLRQVIDACLHRGQARVWSVYNRENDFNGGIIWLFSHGKAVLYFSALSKEGREKGALAWLIDAFIHENESSNIILDFEGSIDPGLARFYSSFGSVVQHYPRLRINHLSSFFKKVYHFYRKLKKD